MKASDLTDLLQDFDVEKLTDEQKKSIDSDMHISFKKMRDVMDTIENNMNSDNGIIKYKSYYCGVSLLVHFFNFLTETAGKIPNDFLRDFFNDPRATYDPDFYK